MARACSLVIACIAVVALMVAPAPSFIGATAPRQPSQRTKSAAAIALAASKPSITEQVEEAGAGQMVRAALSMAAALVVAFMPLAEAHAAKSGGRIGGSAPSMKPRAPPSRAAPPQAVKERVVEKQTTIIQQAPAPMMGAPMMMAPAPSLGDIVVGAAVQGAVGGAVSASVRNAMAPPAGAPSTTDRMLENQMRQDERQLDKQSNDIEDLKRQLAELKK